MVNRHFKPATTSVIVTLTAAALCLAYAGIAKTKTIYAAPALAPSGVSLASVPATRTVPAGQATTYAINLTRTNYPDSVTLSAFSPPSGAVATFSPNPATGSSSSLTITTKITTPVGTYKVKVSGTAKGITIEPITVTLQVTSAPSVTMTIAPEVQCIMAGQGATYAVDIQRTNFDGALTFSASGLPASVTGTFEPQTTTGRRVLFKIMTPIDFGRASSVITIAAAAGELSINHNVRLHTNCGIQWINQTGSFSTDNALSPSYETQSKMTTDGAGNVYIVGNTVGEIIGSDVTTNQGSTDVWLMKYNAAGIWQWARQFGGPEEDRATEVKTDSAGNIYLAGYTAGQIDPSQAHLGSFDVWIAKYDPHGHQLNLRQTGGRFPQFEDGPHGIEIQIDSTTGNVTLIFISTDRTDVTKREFDSNLVPIGDTSFDLPNASFNDLAVGNDGSVYVVGHAFNGTRITGCGNGLFGGEADALVIKFDSNNACVWVGQYPTRASERANRVVVDSSGNLFVSGCRTPATLPGRPASSASCTDAGATPQDAAADDAWVRKLNGSGGEEWFRQFATPARDILTGMAVDNSGSVYLTGLTDRTLTINSAGGTDAWMAKFDANGNQPFLRQFGTTGTDKGLAITVDNYGFVLASGTTDAEIAPLQLGAEDIWVLQYDPSVSPLAITSFSPQLGTAGTTPVTINGHFGIRPTGAYFGGVPATIITSSPTQITATVPIGAISGRIAVTAISFDSCEPAVSATDFVVQ